MKYAIATLLASTSAMKIRNQAAETCSSSFVRMTEQKEYTLASSFVTSNIKSGKFEDPSFKADNSSLWSTLQNDGGQYWSQAKSFQGVESGKGIVWKRPEEILTKGAKPSLWGSEGISVKISEQGYNGDCWFLSSASALAAYPERIKAIFPGQDSYPANGAFQVRLFVKGEPVNVVVDDRVPVHNYSKAMGYDLNYPPVNNGPSKAGAWWLVILEKAMAKLNVNYSNLNGGQIGQAQRYMTGMPTSTLHSGASDTGTTSNDELWKQVQTNLKNDYNMGAACQVSHHHMVSGHAYGVIGALELKGGAHDGQKLIKMRNPWGSSEYDGPWSELDSEWTADYRKQAEGYATTDIGEYYIALEQWQTDYVELVTNYYNEDWKIATAGSMTWSKTWNQLNNWTTLKNTAAQEVIIECVQVESRLFPTIDCENEAAPLTYQFYLFNEKMNQLGASGSCDGDSVVFPSLPAGTYQIRSINFSGESGHADNLKMRVFTSDTAVTMTQQAGNNYVYKP